jgi:hypothetical protein
MQFTPFSQEQIHFCTWIFSKIQKIENQNSENNYRAGAAPGPAISEFGQNGGRHTVGRPLLGYPGRMRRRHALIVEDFFSLFQQSDKPRQNTGD